MTDFGKVAVLYGGVSQEREISLKSGAAVFKGLKNKGVDAHLFDPAEQDLQQLKAQKFDRVFIALHGRGGEDGAIQGALEWLGLPYTGSRVLGSALGMDKIRTKQVWQSVGLPTANYAIVTEQLSVEKAQQLLASLNGKVIVKPACEGSSIGMAMAANAVELVAAITEALKFDREILVEQWITGKEYTVAILNGEALPAIRMQTPHEFYDYTAKYQSQTTQYFCPCGLEAAQEQQLQQFASKAFAAIDAQGWGRIDAMQDEQGDWFLLEANTVPGMTEKSLVPMAAKAKGLAFDDLVVQVLALSK